MALFNHVIREVNAKIVYFGPGFGGKETSVTHIYRKLNPEFRSALKAMTVQGNRMLFFDFRPAEKGVEGYSVRFHLYTVVDEVLKPSTWKMVLKGADGVVFVADSDPTRQQENLDRLNELQTLLTAEGSGIDQIPFVIQYNRRDVPGAVALEEMQRVLNRDNAPGFPSTATTGDGVLPPLSSIIKMSLAKIRESLAEIAVPAAVEIETEVEVEAEVQDEVKVETEVVTAPEVPLVSEAVEPPDETVEFPSGEPARLGEAAPVEGGAKEIRLEITGDGLLADGRLTVPITVTAGSGCREFRLTISFSGVESP
jgi:signal recognition particle receptor subunit beta